MTSEQGAVPNWTVTSQMQMGGQTSTGQYTSGWRVQFRTRTGVDGEVFVPDAEYNPERVRELVSAKAAQILAVHDLSG